MGLRSSQPLRKRDARVLCPRAWGGAGLAHGDPAPGLALGPALQWKAVGTPQSRDTCQHSPRHARLPLGSRARTGDGTECPGLREGDSARGRAGCGPVGHILASFPVPGLPPAAAAPGFSRFLPACSPGPAERAAAPRPAAPTWAPGTAWERGAGAAGDFGGASSPASSPTAQRRTSHRGTPTTEKTTIFLTVKARFTLDWASQTWTGRGLPGDPAAARLWIREVWGRDGGAGCLTSSRRRRHCWPGGPLRASRI